MKSNELTTIFHVIFPVRLVGAANSPFENYRQHTDIAQYYYYFIRISTNLQSPLLTQ